MLIYVLLGFRNRYILDCADRKRGAFNRPHGIIAHCINETERYPEISKTTDFRYQNFFSGL